MLRGILLGIGAVLAAVAVIGATRPESSGAVEPAMPPRLCDRFAAENGSDRNPGTWTRPFESPQRLLRALQPHENGCLRGGTYTSSAPYILDVSKANVTIRSTPRERAHLRGIIRVRDGANRFRLSRLSIEGPGGMNTVKVYSEDFVLERSDVTNAWRGGSCLILGNNSDGGAAVRPMIRLNHFHQCGVPGLKFDHGIYAANVTDGRIVDNLFSGVSGYAIILYPNAQRTVFSHNIVDGSAPSVRGGVVFGGDFRYVSRDNLVENNVIAYAQTFNITSNWDGDEGSGNVARANCVWEGRDGDIGNVNGFVEQSNVSADPRFVDRSEGDYRLRKDSSCLSVVGYDTAAKLRGG